MRLLFDQNVPRPLADRLPGHDVTRAVQLGWDELANGRLIAAAEAAGFEVLVTCDKGWRHQQNLADRRIAILVLPTNRWPQLRDHVEEISAAVDRVRNVGYLELELPRLPLNRRPPPVRG